MVNKKSRMEIKTEIELFYILIFHVSSRNLNFRILINTHLCITPIFPIKWRLRLSFRRVKRNNSGIAEESLEYRNGKWRNYLYLAVPEYLSILRAKRNIRKAARTIKFRENHRYIIE